MPQHWRLAFPVLAGLAYGVSPIDLIPDLLPLIGLVDDTVVGLIVALMVIAQVVRKRQSARVVARSAQPLQPPIIRR